MGMADKMSEAVVDAIKIVKKPDVPVDLHMVEIMHMKHKLSNETTLVRGLVPGAGAFEVAAHVHLEEYKKSVQGKARLGVEIFSKAMLVVPKTLLDNSGLDVQDKLLAVV